MPVWILESPAAIAMCAILFVALVSIVVRAFVLPLLGIELFRRVRLPWRFSLLSLVVLVLLAALVLGFLRDLPDLALLGFVVVLVVWHTVVRYVAFRRDLADRSCREMARILGARERGKEAR